MIPIVIMAIEDESDRDYITRLFLKNERGMYAMALKIVKEHHTACDMVSEACLKMIEKIGYLREISVQKQTPYILSIVKNTSLMYLRQRRSENSYLVDDERILDCAAASQDDLDAALISEAESQVIRQALERRARKAEQSLAQERAQAKEDRRELAALREMLFLQENADASGDAVSISFPHEVKRRLIVYGGHETWRKAMKEYLTGEIRYMDKEQAIIDRSVIRNADMIWIQSNALSHRQYYAVIDEVRKTGVPVKYFLDASARKCAEQVVREDD